MEVSEQQDNGEVEKTSGQKKLGFARRLASPDKKTRDKAISLLVVWLTSQKAVSEADLKKIWKGLFYCVWHADKVSVQADLIERLASLLENLDLNLSLEFFKVFLITMRREWTGIDRLRLDKFYLLLRKYLNHMFVALENQGWNAEWTKKFMDALEERTFLATDHHAAQGINLHYADIFLQELERFLPLKAGILCLLLEPFCNILAKTLEKPLIKRVRGNVFDKLLHLARAAVACKQEGQDLDDCVENFGSLTLLVPISSKIFNLASLSSISQMNRKVLYELHYEFSKMQKLLAASCVTMRATKGANETRNDSRVNMLCEGANIGNTLQVTANVLTEDTGDLPVAKGRKELGTDNRKRTKASKADPALRELIKVHKNFSTSDKAGILLGGRHMRASQGQEEREENGIGIGRKALLPEKKQKLKSGKADLIEISKGSLERRRLKAKGSVDLYVKKRKRKASDNIDGCRVIMSEQETVVCDSTENMVYDSQVSDAGEDMTAHLKDSSMMVADSEICFSIDDPVIANLDKRFDSIGAEGSSDLNTYSTPVQMFSFASSPISTCSKKLKKGKSLVVSSHGVGFCGNQETEVCPGSVLMKGEGTANNTADKKLKKVRFALRNNLVWKPFSPLPPQILRVPPSATPRGSALKKGVAPGPVLVLSPNQRKLPMKRASHSAQRPHKRLKSFRRASTPINKRSLGYL
eukprot:c26081_g1_i2 orf=249-2342(+)